RRTAIETLAAKYAELAEDAASGPVFVSHADCIKDVNLLNDILMAKHGRGIDLVESVGTVIGAHSGPGTLALFFIGKNR
ncbi:MAG: DegV family protein, partial [Clostridia bacterium]|nr:DegV family protein [Clostridia bacterium]